MVNLTVFNANGTPHSRTSVALVQGDDAAPDSAFCGWMPFQKNQAARQDAALKDVNHGQRIGQARGRGQDHHHRRRRRGHQG
ncbi:MULTISPECIES: hypothetical protein [unclassified Variovorax]|jgi:hypothetical protein|uniref:hypothetical protein n=1 Tax=unclassified Variovorax TaxID=663243 RepID=UPI00116014D8|nr:MULTISPECIES: hypothetical protein [unclassified Variovorax]